MARVVILNDTGTEAHHGCQRVMAVLREALVSRGLEIAATSGTGRKWWRDGPFLLEMAGADLILVNGEGTLHHGRRRGEALLKVADHRAARAPLVLVNALYQANPPHWAEALSRFSLVLARDAASAEELGAALGRPVAHVPDLSLCSGAVGALAPREGVVFGDSVFAHVAGDLAKMSERHGGRLVPILSQPRSVKGRSAVARWLSARASRRQERGLRATYATYAPAPDAAAYAGELRSAQLHITGRFHGVCYSLLTETPFLAIASNSWKIEALMDEVGLKNRIVSLQEADSAARTPLAHAFTEAERTDIARYLESAKLRAGDAFDEVKRLADARREGLANR